jgi:transcriptional regulator with AAA-type ATPase domain
MAGRRQHSEPVHATRTATQTGDPSEGGQDGRLTSRLVRFLRADEPWDIAEEFHLSGRAEWTLGRIDGPRVLAPSSSRTHIWSCNDASMSSRHATLADTADGWIIADSGSKNGTFLNGERLIDRRVLRDGDILQLGSSFFIYLRERRGAAMFSGRLKRGLAPLDYQIDPLLPFAASDLSIHLYGETGTGKDVIARAIHDLSGRQGVFVARNCAAIPENLFESELFGYSKGAFSGASTAQQGQILAAAGGTLFLDEIGELSLPLQAKLLRVLELKEVQPLGASTPIAVDFRLVSATLCDLEAMVAAGRFRQDLYGRLGRSFRVPPLREHKEHLGLLIQRVLLGKFARLSPLPPVRFKIEAARAMVRHSWPLNVRELKQCVESALTVSIATGLQDGAYVVELCHLPRSVLADSANRSPRCPVETVPAESRGPLSDDEVVASLRAVQGNRAKAAKVLGLSERTIFRRVEQLRKRGVKV